MLLSEGVRMGATGVVILLLTRVFLTPSQYGLLFLAMSVLGVALLVSFPFSKSGARFLSQYRETDPSQVPHILSWTFRYNLVGIAGVGVLLLVLAGPIASLFGEPALEPLLVVGVVYVAAKTLSSYASIAFQGLNRIRLSAFTSAISNASLLVFVVVFLLAGLGVFGAFLGYVAAPLLSAAVGLAILYVGWYRRAHRSAPVEAGLAGRILRYSVPLTGTRVAHTLDTRVDIIMVGAFLNPASVGFYTLAKQVVDFVTAPATSIGFTVSPAYGEHVASGDRERAARLFEATLTNALLLYLPASVGIVLVARPAVRYVFGPAYLGTAPVLQVFGAFVLLRAVGKLMHDSLDYIGRARIRAATELGSALANVVLNLLLIPTMGAAGAALATVITFGALVAVELVVVGQEFPLDVGHLVRFTASVAAVTAVMAAVVVWLVSYVTGLLSLVAVVALGGGVWLVLTVATGLLGGKQLRFVTGSGN